MEMHVAPVPFDLQQRETKGGLPRSENPTNQTFPILDTPATAATSGDVKVMRVRTVYKRKILHCKIPILHRKREREARIEHDPSEHPEKADHKRAFAQT
jgi:hypothetical protein